MANAEQMRVEVAYARADEQVLLEVQVAAGTTVEGAIEASGILQRFPEIDLTAQKVGVYGKLARLDTVLREGDRVEIYRPLIADPKEVRKKRAAEGKKMKKGAGSS
jgi:putative ubiquitin-RnfH superfamily antitoxin RatB of RatAB toxin-antitoxin module